MSSALAKRELRREIKQKLDAMKLASGCVDCGYRDSPIPLEWDHSFGTKNFTIGSQKVLNWERIAAEVELCLVRCSNCHKQMTAMRRLNSGNEFERDTFLRLSA